MLRKGAISIWRNAKIVKTLNNTHTTNEEGTNNSFRNTQKHTSVDTKRYAVWYEQRRHGTQVVYTQQTMGREGLQSFHTPEYLIQIRLSGFQSLLLLIYFCFGQNTFSRCTKVWHTQPNWYVTFHFRDQLSAASLGYRSCAKITVFAHVWAESLSCMVFVPAKQLSGRVWTKPKYSRPFLSADLAKSDLWYR